MRTNQARKSGPALLDRPETANARPRIEEIRRAPSEPVRPRREYPGAPSNDFDPEDTAVTRNRGRGRRIRRGLIPQTKNGRIAAAAGLALFLAAIAAGCYKASQFLHHDPRFLIAASSNIELQGNTHLSRSQLLSVFGEDIDGNLFTVPLKDRRDQLEQMPWVEHATVMRLLPNRLRVDVVERTPVAFVRQAGASGNGASSIGMADRSGVLLDIPPDAPGNPNYSFPVVTGLRADDTAESRESRMRLYSAFLHDLDSEGKKVSADLSEVDLSDPEDLKALLPSGNGAETLVHFGTGNFLHRYQRFQDHIAEWRTQYPRLSSVDMRYERQVVLQMPPKDSTVAPPGTADATASQAQLTAPKAAAIHTAAAPLPAPAHTVPALRAPVLAPATLPPHPASTARPMALHNGTAAPAPHTKPATTTRQADIARRVAKIKEWMARRQQARTAAH